MKVKMVRFYDLDTKQLFNIPASELPSNAIRVGVEGIEEPVWIEATKVLLRSPYQHPPFPEELRVHIRKIMNLLAEPHPLTFEKWEDGFRRDMFPERQIIFWLRLAEAYQQLTSKERLKLRRKEIFRCLVACQLSDEDTILYIFKSKILSPKEIKAIAKKYHGSDFSSF